MGTFLTKIGLPHLPGVVEQPKLLCEPLVVALMRDWADRTGEGQGSRASGANAVTKRKLPSFRRKGRLKAAAGPLAYYPVSGLVDIKREDLPPVAAEIRARIQVLRNQIDATKSVGKRGAEQRSLEADLEHRKQVLEHNGNAADS